MMSLSYLVYLLDRAADGLLGSADFLAYLVCLLGRYSALADPRIAFVGASVWLWAGTIHLLGRVTDWLSAIVRGAGK